MQHTCTCKVMHRLTVFIIAYITANDTTYFWLSYLVSHTNDSPCSVRPLEDVLVQVHDEVDSAGDLHVEVALRQEQQVAIVWHDVSVFFRASSIVDIAPVIDVSSFPEWLWKVLSAMTIVVQAGTSVVMDHVMQH